MTSPLPPALRRTRPPYFTFVLIYVATTLLGGIVGASLEDRYPSGWAILAHRREIPPVQLALYLAACGVTRIPFGMLLDPFSGPIVTTLHPYTVIPDALLAAWLFHALRQRWVSRRAPPR